MKSVKKVFEKGELWDRQRNSFGPLLIVNENTSQIKAMGFDQNANWSDSISLSTG